LKFKNTNQFYSLNTSFINGTVMLVLYLRSRNEGSLSVFWIAELILAHFFCFEQDTVSCLPPCSDLIVNVKRNINPTRPGAAYGCSHDWLLDVNYRACFYGLRVYI
jgi:hypothetical protein